MGCTEEGREMIDATTGTGWFPALTLLVGFATSSFAEWLRQRYANKRERAAAEATREQEREARESERRIQLFERRTSFQRETLLNLQDAIVKLARATGRMQHLDLMEYRKTGNWGKQPIPSDLNDDAHQANVIIMVLKARVRDDLIREMTGTFQSQANLVAISRSEQASKEVSDKMVGELGPLHERIGEVLRKLDDDEDSQQ
jgi:uncharacterized coiled-coil protein SlyX